MTQGMRDALGDAETLRIIADRLGDGNDWSLWYAGWYGSDAAQFMRDNSSAASYRAASAAHSAFLAVPGLRG